MQIRHRGKLAFGATGLASVLAAGVALAAGSTTYAGHTSQGRLHPVTVTVDAQKHVAFNIRYNESCYTPAGKLAGGSNGTFGFNLGAGVAVTGQSSFSHKASFHHVRTSGTPPQFFNSTDQVNGKVGTGSASGTFSFIGKFYDQHGVYKGSCKTGALHWSAKKK